MAERESEYHGTRNEANRVFRDCTQAPLMGAPVIDRHAAPIRIDLPGVAFIGFDQRDRRCPAHEQHEGGAGDQHKTPHGDHKPEYRSHLRTDRHLDRPRAEQGACLLIARNRSLLEQGGDPLSTDRPLQLGALATRSKKGRLVAESADSGKGGCVWLRKWNGIQRNSLRFIATGQLHVVHVRIRRSSTRGRLQSVTLRARRTGIPQDCDRANVGIDACGVLGLCCPVFWHMNCLAEGAKRRPA